MSITKFSLHILPKLKIAIEKNKTQTVWYSFLHVYLREKIILRKETINPFATIL